MSTPTTARIGLFESVLAHAPGGIVIGEPDADGVLRVTFANDAFLAMCDVPLRGVLGQPLDALRAPGAPGDGLRSWAFSIPADDGTAARVVVYSGAPAPARTEQRIRSLIENINELILLVDRDGTIAYASTSVRRMLGYEPEELAGRPVFTLVDPDQREHAGPYWTALIGGTDDRTRVEGRFVRADGDVRIFEIDVTNRLDDPDVGGVIVTARDVTERAEAAEQLRQSEERARALVQRGSDLIIVLDAHGVVTFVAPSITEVLGYPVDQLIGTNVFTLVHPDDRVEALAQFTTRVEDDPDVYTPAEVRVRSLDSTWRRLGVYATNLLDHPGVNGIVLHARDLTRDEVARQSTERRFQALVQNSADVIVVTDPTALVTYCSPAFERLLQVSRGGVTNRSLLERIEPQDRPAAARMLDDVLHATEPVVLELRFRLGDGEVRDIQLRGTNLLADHDVQGIVFNGSDVTDRKRAEAHLAEEAALLEDMARGFATDRVLERIAAIVDRGVKGARCAVGVVDGDGVIRYRVSPSLPLSLARRLDAIEPESELGQLVRSGDTLLLVEDVTSAEDWRPLADELLELGLAAWWGMPVSAPADGALVGFLTVFHPDARQPDEHELAVLRRARHLAAIAMDRARFEARLEQQALYDALTGLPNRALLLNRIDHALSLAARHERAVAVLFIDLDNFKVINDSLGHAAGDDLLEQAAVRFATAVRSSDTVGRFGGDEFLVLCEELHDEEEATFVAERIRATLERPFTLNGEQVHVTASVGIALRRTSTTSADDLIRDADVAMYRAKELGKDRSERFVEELHARAVERLEMERDLRVALGTGQLVVHYQPIVRVEDGMPIGLEALVRWERPGAGLVGPDRFVGIAEETGLIGELGELVLATAAETLHRIDAELGAALDEPLTMSVNVSTRQLASSRLVEQLSAMVDGGIDPSRLCLEVTENALLVEVDRAQAVLGRLHELGVQVAIDDFGTGYASLDYLRRFTSATALKIDRSFVAGIEGDAHDRAIVAASVVLAQRIGLTAVAEGVEAPAQVEFLRRIGCDAAQGYLFSRPVPGDEVGATVLELARRATQQ